MEYQTIAQFDPHREAVRERLVPFGHLRPRISAHSALLDADRLSDPPNQLGSAGPSFLDHDARGGEPLDCGIVEAVLAQHLARVLRESGWR